MSGKVVLKREKKENKEGEERTGIDLLKLTGY